MSETPRVDALLTSAHGGIWKTMEEDHGHPMSVPASFARQLERELTALLAQTGQPSPAERLCECTHECARSVLRSNDDVLKPGYRCRFSLTDSALVAPSPAECVQALEDILKDWHDGTVAKVYHGWPGAIDVATNRIARAKAALAAAPKPAEQGDAQPRDYSDAQLDAGLSMLRHLRQSLGEHLSDETLCGCVYDVMRGVGRHEDEALRAIALAAPKPAAPASVVPKRLCACTVASGCDSDIRSAGKQQCRMWLADNPAEPEKDAEDAARYRRARLHARMTCNGSTHVSFEVRLPGPPNEHGFVDPGLPASAPECFDAAIDAARAADTGGKG